MFSFLCAFTGGEVAARASQPVDPGSSSTTTCRFVPSADSTDCVHRTVTVTAGGCSAQHQRLSFTERVESSRTYRGDAVRPGLAGVETEGTYGDVVRPQAVLVYDSGPHGYSVGSVVDDPACP